MIETIKVSKIIENVSGDYFEIVRENDTIDPLYGLEHRKITDNDIKALKEGNFLYCTDGDGEYAQLISYEPQESEGKK